MRITSAVCGMAVLLYVSALQLRDEDPALPLFITRYLSEGRIQEAREAAKVPPMMENGDVESYSGYFTVDAKLQSNLFFWFFPAEIDPGSAPVLLWLQGGPGVSSLYGLFSEIGPYSVSDDLKLQRRDLHWSREMNVIYIDNPVGTGFSFTGSNDGYARNETAVGNNLYTALQQFFQLFPELRENKFFLAGESYAGKYIPALAHVIHKNNPTADSKISLEGLAIGDGWIDPGHMMVVSDYLFQLGIIDQNTFNIMQEIEKNTADLIEQQRYGDAAMVDGKKYELLNKVAGSISLYDFTKTGGDDSLDTTMKLFLSQPATRKSLHVGNRKFGDSEQTVSSMLDEDQFKSVAPWFQDLLDQYRVLLYNGQLDIIVGYPLTMNFLKTLKWSGADAYAKAQRKQWHVDGQLAGFAKTVKGFTEVLVRNAGHMVPADQPLWALDLITRFTKNIPFD